MKVCKFGGTSMANGETISRVIDIVKSDPQRKYIVVSAPGKRSLADVKVTDALYACFNEKLEKGNCTQSFEVVRKRFKDIVRALDLDFDIDSVLDEVKAGIDKSVTKDYAASRGEYLNALILAKKLGFEFVDTQNIIKFSDEKLQMHYSLDLIKQRLEGVEYAVIPGFYGSNRDGRITTFSRGGSDITGALIARAVGADVYENWTDVSGILMADPRIVDDPEPIRRVTYSELRELSYIGAQVLHEGTIFPVREKNIPLNIRNTNAPDHPGTMILESIEDEQKEGGFITGIAGKKGFSIITIAKTGMSSEPGTLLKILNVLAKHEVNVEYLPSGIDNVSLVVSSDKVSRSLYEMLGELQKEVQPNKITVTEHIAIVAAVGRKMAYQPGVSGKIFAKLGENGVNIRMITQGPEELNIIVGVEEKDFEQAIRVLYNSFVKENVV